jgi:acyl carrier protein
VAQLTQRTNQFNFTTIRHSEADLQRFLDSGAGECFTVEVSDRFGDYGLVGAVIVSKEREDLAIETFLLSCRVLGRGVEHRVMAFLAELCAGTVVARLQPSGRNAPAQQFLDSIGAQWKSESDGVFTYRFPAESIRGLAWKPVDAVANAVPAGNRVTLAAQHRPDYVRIAQTLFAPAQILAEVRRESRGALAVPTSATPTIDPPSTETEVRLADIWADLLHQPSISASDNFFDLGGHSLLAVLLLVRIQETFGIELSIDDVYSGALTLAGLAQRIDMRESPEYAELLREIEAMSDEEARQLLAEADPD